MTDEWPADEFDRRLARTPRVVVLFHAEWCPHSRIFLPDFEAANAESPVPFARADLSASGDGRWRAHGIRATPTVAYFEHGEELERIEAAPRAGIDRDGFDAFLETVHGLQEPEVNERWLSRASRRRRRGAKAGGPTRGAASRRP